MTKSILNLEGVQVLSRNEQKNVNGGKLPGGGKGCKLVAPNGNGGYTTYSGTCDTGITGISGYLCDGCPMPSVSTASFCNIGDGVIYPLKGGASSNC